MVPLAHQVGSLQDAELVLFIHHGQAEPRETNSGLQEGMGADHAIHLSVRETIEHRLSLATR
jgi:hypothetical protein